MTGFALTLLLVAAVLHASWNLCAKRAGGGLPFVWLVSAVICGLYVPVLIGYWLWKQPVLSGLAIAWIAGSAVLKTGYSLFLQRAYRTGDFSLIYPLARGTGPLLSTLGAIVFLGERPSALAIGGGFVIITAVFALTGGFDRVGPALRGLSRFPRRPVGSQATGESPPHLMHAIHCGLASGVFIAAYTLWDRQGVHALAIPPLVYDGGTAFLVLALLTPSAIPRHAEVARHWRVHKRYVFGMAVLSPVAYVLVLTAMSFTPVSYVAPAREVSIVIGAYLGARFLKEADGRRRIWAALAMAAGVIALALG